ncbi:hypothetical protein PRIPAC_76661 [Pristionchus pacificus]|uniref:Uncharacterized protein n=1 Tax=Pristionchus pacificus TaxID=54126 RepID=A0A2A6CFI3_PRIPA|nr:hypothetical protein PRIPAC_76661 [Pristionchus pacificus]|eukprot:PDM76771.1 hypothetical protein PRIPAC_42166 [Pristionchus pacificus]
MQNEYILHFSISWRSLIFDLRYRNPSFNRLSCCPQQRPAQQQAHNTLGRINDHTPSSSLQAIDHTTAPPHRTSSTSSSNLLTESNERAVPLLGLSPSSSLSLDGAIREPIAPNRVKTLAAILKSHRPQQNTGNDGALNRALREMIARHSAIESTHN